MKRIKRNVLEHSRRVDIRQVRASVAVRYAWEASPTCNLYNGTGLPASPFRTDAWATTSAPTEKRPQQLLPLIRR